MNKERAQPSLARFIVLACAVVSMGQIFAQTPDSTATATLPAASSVSGSATARSDSPLQITGLLEDPAGQPINGKDATGQDVQSHVELGSKLWVLLNRAPPKPADQYALFLNGVEVRDSGPAIDAADRPGGPVAPALLFKLKRGKNDDAFWKDLLGSPRGRHVPVSVSLGEVAEPGKPTPPKIVGADPNQSTFQLQVFTAARLSLATIVILGILILVWGHARTRTTLRDNLLPQLEVSCQPYSLGRWQMAFWFTLVFVAFIFLLFLLQDANTITAQALLLMGISGVTAAASVAVDVAKDSPADATNRGLRALGLNTFDDVQRVRREILDRQRELGTSPSEHRRIQLQIEIKDRASILRTYEEKTRPFVSQGWFKDITTDLNGTAVHRLQVVCWTITLGTVFVIDVYRQLSMPQFDGMLLALMGISSAGYVGFKVQEVNS